MPRKPAVDIEAPVKVVIEITGEDLGTCLFGLLDISAALHSGKTSGAVDPGSAEGFTFTVTNTTKEPASAP